MQPFNYDEDFFRNIGWLPRQEQESSRHKRMAIPSLGGVGPTHLQTLSPFEIGRFNLALADFDGFDTFSIKYHFSRPLLGLVLAPHSREAKFRLGIDSVHVNSDNNIVALTVMG